MAHHKDINRASALLEGTQGWSIKNAKTQQTKNKRNKRSCVYYQKEHCSKLDCVCMGSSDCASYHN